MRILTFLMLNSECSWCGRTFFHGRLHLLIRFLKGKSGSGLCPNCAERLAEQMLHHHTEHTTEEIRQPLAGKTTAPEGLRVPS